MFQSVSIRKLDNWYWCLEIEHKDGKACSQVVHNDHLASVIAEIQKVVAREYRRLEYGDVV